MPEPADDSYTVDAMVGQVNGRPIYAGDVFKRIGEPQFVNLGQSLPRLEFRQEASRLVAAHLRDIIANSMILAEAEQSLTEQEQLGLLDLLKKERENIINQFGGFLSGAEQGLKRDRGVTLEEYIESRRQEVLVQKFLRENLWPKIHISRRDVERYYREHYDEYHQPGSVTLRMIVVRNEPAAADVEAALAEGTPFADVASKHSRIRAGQGGLLSEMRLRDGLKRFKGTRWRTLNEAVRKLEKGEHTDRVKIDRGFAWAYVEEIKPPKSIALREVYLEIEQKLKTAEFNRLSQKYLADLMAKGSYTPVDRMAESLVEVAMNRYAQPREK